MEINSLARLGAVGLAALLVAASCTDEGVIYLTRVSDEQTGSNCTDGGQKLDFGADSDADGLLASTEITATAYVCNGAASRGAIVTNVPLVAGNVNCPAGGFALTVGVDRNQNGAVDGNEGVTRFVCNMSPPGSAADASVPGPAGADGADGTNGTNGTDGTNGFTTLIETDFRDGPGDDCGTAGWNVTTGLDRNRNGVLDVGDDQQGQPSAVTRELCNGTDGFTTLTTVIPFDDSSACPSGGVLVSFGLDLDRNDGLDPGEATSEVEICGPAGPAGDAGAPGDAGDAGDAGASVDAGAQSDAGAQNDAGAPGDAGAQSDAAASGDAGDAAAPALLADGQTCAIDAECLGGYCNPANLCKTPPLANGQRCDVNANCLSTFCASNGFVLICSDD
jgi:hypothetical protein